MQIYKLLQFIANFNFIMLLIVPLGSFAESPPVIPTEEEAEVKQKKFLFFSS